MTPYEGDNDDEENVSVCDDSSSFDSKSDDDNDGRRH